MVASIFAEQFFIGLLSLQALHWVQYVGCKINSMET